jgi:HSP20 family protein
MLDMIVPSRFGLFRREVDQLFSDLFGNGWNGDREAPASFPALNIWEDGQNLYAEAEMPGIKIEQIEISVTGDQLTLRGERKSEEKAGITCHRRERDFGAFTRVMRLPAPIDASRVEASLKNGVLTITLPKSEQARPRRIEVKSAS